MKGLAKDTTGMRAVSVDVFGQHCAQVLEVARVLCEVTSLAGLEPQAAALRKVQGALSDAAHSEGLPAESAFNVPITSADSCSVVRDDSKADRARLSAELQALCSELESTSGEVRLARKEAHDARAEVSKARAATESQEVRMRVFATEMEHLRSHVADSMRRSEEDLEACRTCAASDASDTRRLISDSATEARALRQSIRDLEQADRQREADAPNHQAVCDAALKRIERTTTQRLSEANAVAETRLSRFEQSSEEAVAIMQAELGKMHERLDKVLSDRQLDEWAQAAAAAADTLAATAMVPSSTGEMSTPGAIADWKPVHVRNHANTESLAGMPDMPRSWRNALEDVVRRAQWVSEESRHELIKRSEELVARFEAHLASAETQQARRLEEVGETCEEALRRADDAVSTARCSKELAQESQDAASRKATSAMTIAASELRAELKAATGDLSTRLEDGLQAQQWRLASLDEASAAFCKGLAAMEVQTRHTEEVSVTLGNRVSEVGEIALRNARAIEEHKAKLKGFLDPFRDEMDRRFTEVWREVSEVRSSLGQHDRKASDDVASARAVWQARCDELRSTLDELSVRLDREVLEWADRAGKTEALKRRLSEEVAAAVDARCGEVGDFAQKLQDTLLVEVGKSLNSSGHHAAELTQRVAQFEAALEFAQKEAMTRQEQFQAALSAADRLASAAQEDASDAQWRSKHVEAFLSTLVRTGPEFVAPGDAQRLPASEHQPEAAPSRTVFPCDHHLANLPDSVIAGGSGVGAARQLRAHAPRRPASARFSRDTRDTRH